jgi:hypothetical protein
METVILISFAILMVIVKTGPILYDMYKAGRRDK